MKDLLHRLICELLGRAHGNRMVLRLRAREQAWHAHSCKCGSIAVYDEPSSNSHCHTQPAHSAMSHTLGDIFEVRSCGAPFSGMNMGTNWSKSACTTPPRPRTARAQWGVIQHATNWHTFPVQPPLTDTEFEKKTSSLHWVG